MASQIRSCVRGVGAALPARVVTNAGTRRQGGHFRRMDPPAQRNHAALHRGRRRDDLDAGDRGRRGGAPPRRPQGRRHRSDHRRDRDAGLHLSGGRDPGPGQSRHHPRASLSTCRRSARGFVFARDDRRQVPALRLAQAGAGYRRRDLLAHPRLERPHDLRAVRRRRGRDGARGAGERRRLRLARRDRRRGCAPTGGIAPSSSSTADRRRPRPPAIFAWRARRCSATPSAWCRT